MDRQHPRLPRLRGADAASLTESSSQPGDVRMRSLAHYVPVALVVALLGVSTRALAAEVSAKLATSMGEIVVRLFPDDAPVTVGNFVTLARQKFYDGTIFHRVVPGFVVQGGDPKGTGQGGPGYCFADEIRPARTHAKEGVLSM